MKPEDMSNAGLARELDDVCNGCSSAGSVPEDVQAMVHEAARRLRGPDYKAEAMAWREAMDSGTIQIKPTGDWGYPTRQDEEDFEPVRKIRIANESKEAANG